MQILSPHLTLKKLCLPLLMGVALTSCGSSGGGDKKIDLSHYFFPDSSRTQTYDDTYGGWIDIWQVNGNTLTQTSGGGTTTYTIGKDVVSAIYTDEEDDWTDEWERPRFAKIGENLADKKEQEEGIVSTVLGSLSSKTFELGSQKRTYKDMIVFVYYDPEYEVELTYYAKGIGEVFWTYYYDCPKDLKLSMETDFSAECDSDGDNSSMLVKESSKITLPPEDEEEEEEEEEEESEVIEISYATAQAGYEGTVGLGSSIYEITGLTIGEWYAVSLTNIDGDDIDLYVVSDEDSCDSSNGGTGDEQCYIQADTTSVWVEVYNYDRELGASFTLSIELD